MKTYHQLISKFKNQRGATAIIVAIALAMLIGFVALAVDIGYLAATKNELQDIADAAALAGAGNMGDQYLNTPPLDGIADCDKIRKAAKDTAFANKAAGLNISIDDSDVEFGRWIDNAWNANSALSVSTCTFDNSDTSGGIPITDNDKPTAIKVTARRDSDPKSAEGPITTFFARIFGIQTVDVRADAIAALTPVGEVHEIQLPIGLSINLFNGTHDCQQDIDFTNTTLSCAGWNNFENDSINANLMDGRLLGMITGDGCPSTGCDVGPTDTEPDGDIDENDTNLSEGEAWWLKTPVPPATIPPDHFEDYSGYDLPARAPAEGADLDDGTEFIFQGGTIGALFTGDANAPAPMVALYDYFRTHDDTYEDPDEYPPSERALAKLSNERPGTGYGGIDWDLIWTTFLPIYADPDPDVGECGNPTGKLEIKGFAKVYVYNITPQPSKTLQVYFDACEWSPIQKRGEGAGVGNILGYIPNLVE